MEKKYDFAFLLPTRGRTEALERCITSMIERADNPQRMQIMLGFDRDDVIGVPYFQEHIKPMLDRQKVPYTAMLFDPMGYTSLHIYSNKLAKFTDAKWLVIWNDDTIMETQGWDTEIMKYDGQFKLLAFHTHNDHPYSIFPIVPNKWFELLGYISPHPTQDGWVSQQAYLLDIWERIPVWVTHDRFDLTGNNKDDTYRKRRMLEGNPSDPQDFHSVTMIDLRHRDAAKLADYIKNVLKGDISFFENVFKGTQDPWEKLAKNDINKQMVQFDNPHKHFNNQQQTAKTDKVT